jgi:hypothetical protein
MPYNNYDPIADLYDVYVPADFDFAFADPAALFSYPQESPFMIWKLEKVG